MEFREWLSSDLELEGWMRSFKAAVLRTIQVREGYISLAFNRAVAAPVALPTMNRGQSQPMRLAASVEHPGAILGEVTEKGWKGPTATAAIAGSIGHWSVADRRRFEKKMDGGKSSLPSLVGKEMGLLFECEVFLYLVGTYKLRPIGLKDAAYVGAEKVRIENEIMKKLKDARLAAMVGEFIRTHAGGGSVGMGEMIYRKSLSLIKDCVVDSIEFMGGDGGAYSSHLKSDTADMRIGCSAALSAGRSDIGYSLKAVTETQVEVRSLSVGKAMQLLGGGKNAIGRLRALVTNPLMEDSEKKEAMLGSFEKAGVRHYQNKPRRFARLLELLVTGGADTIPAYRMLIRNIGEPGWSGALGKDFVTGEGPGAKLSARSGVTIDVKRTNTYVSLTYMVPGGNHYGTSIKFEPSADGSKISVYVSNLVSKGGRGY